jgi:predicted RNA-binding Zn-ribbon protein involved in translation (DUF1610 family)
MSVDNDKNKNKITSDIPSDAERSVQMLCPSCGGDARFDREDDAKTKWFKCEACGQQTSKPLHMESQATPAHPNDDAEAIDRVIATAPVKDTLLRIVKDDPNAKLSQADKLILLCQSRRPVLFTDQTGAAYAQVDVAGVNVIWPLRSAVFKSWLAGLLWASEQKAPSVTATYSALNVLFSMAHNSGHKYTLYNRVAPAEDGFWLDMTDSQYRAIKVTADGWHIVENPPILFRRYSHQLPLVEPKTGGDAWKILGFFNIDMDDENTKLTTLTAAISFLIPDIPHPILCAYRHQGSAKSYMFKLMKRTIDPSAVELLSLPYEERERVQQLDHHWLCFYDNITSLSTQVSDTLCRAATGAGFSKRELYSDDDDVIYNFKRCVGLNGINIAASRGDLLDRSLLVGMRDIPKEKRKTEQQINSEFEACKAEILGAFLDVLAKAMKLYPSVNPKGLFRMADYTRWGCCIAIALGKTEQNFINAYETKVNEGILEAAQSSSLATVLLSMLEGTTGWTGTPTELHTKLINHAKTLEISTRTKGWPKAPHILTRQLNELAPSLKALGWEVNALRNGTQRIIDIKRVTSDIEPEEAKREREEEEKKKAEEAKRKEEGADASLPSVASPPSLSLATQVASPVKPRICHGKSMDNDGCDASDASALSSLFFSLRQSLQSNFTQEDALTVISRTKSYTEKEAEAIFQVLINDGKIAMLPDGRWSFT